MVSKKFVQLGERKNGRIVKNEQYTVDKFLKLVFPIIAYEEPHTITWFDRTFKTEKYVESRIRRNLRNQLRFIMQDVHDNILTLIEQDNYGRSKRK